MRPARPGAPSITVRVDPASRIPPFEQLRGQLALLISSGRLRPGDRLPTVRQLAEELELATGTVARTYRELEYAGVIEGRGRQGTFVSANAPDVFSARETQRRLAEAADVYVLVARQLGADDRAIIEGLTAALRTDTPRADTDPHSRGGSG